MPYVAVSSSPIRVRHTGGSADPDYGIEAGSPDQGLPGNQPGIDNTLPYPPPGVWPPPTIANPIVPIPPGTSVPPGTIWPSPGGPVHPGHGLPVQPGHPDQGLPSAPVRPGQGLPAQPGHPDQSLPSSTFWVVAGIPGLGWRYVCVDPSLEVGMPLPPSAQPKA